MASKLYGSRRVLACLGLALCSIATVQAADNWEKLGQETLKADRTEATISVGIDEGWYRWVKLKSDGGTVDLRKVKIVFSDGEKKVFDSFGVLVDGAESRPLPIAGTFKRFVRRIEFEYKLGDRAEGVKIKALGRRSD